MHARRQCRGSMRNILCQFIESQSHFGMLRGAKNGFGSQWTKISCSPFKFKQYNLQACTITNGKKSLLFVWRTTNGGSEDELPSRSPIELRDNTNASNPDSHKIEIPAVQPQQHNITGPKKIIQIWCSRQAYGKTQRVSQEKTKFLSSSNSPNNVQPPKAPTTVDASPFRREIIPFHSPSPFGHMSFLHWFRPHFNPMWILTPTDSPRLHPHFENKTSSKMTNTDTTKNSKYYSGLRGFWREEMAGRNADRSGAPLPITGYCTDPGSNGSFSMVTSPKWSQLLQNQSSPVSSAACVNSGAPPPPPPDAPCESPAKRAGQARWLRSVMIRHSHDDICNLILFPPCVRFLPSSLPPPPFLPSFFLRWLSSSYSFIHSHFGWTLLMFVLYPLEPNIFLRICTHTQTIPISSNLMPTHAIQIAPMYSKVV